MTRRNSIFHSGLLISLALGMMISFSALAEAPNAVLLQHAQQGLESLTAEEVRGAGYQVQAIGMADLCDATKLSAEAVDLLVLPDAAELPTASMSVIEAYLKGGGDILALNAPLWQRPLLEDNGEWVARETYRKRHAEQLLEHVIFDFPNGAIDGWNRTTNDLSVPATHELIPGAPPAAPAAPARHALHVTIENLSNWDTFVAPDLSQPFPEGHDLTVFWAKGGPNTTGLAVEWDEKDGSRWIATVPLTHEWQQFVLDPRDFRFWESVPSRAKTVFNPANAVRMSVGLALTHTQTGGGPHEYWVGTFGTAKRTQVHEKLLSLFKAPRLDALCPGYKFFPCRDVASVSGCAEAFVSVGEFLPVPNVGSLLPAPDSIRSPHPRPMAGGFDKGRDWRWQPLMKAWSPENRWWRGSPGAMLVHADGPYKGGVWVSFGVGDLDWYTHPSVLKIIGDAAKAMCKGVFIVDAGTNFYTYFEKQDVTLGLTIVNVSLENRVGLVGRVGLFSDRSVGSDGSVRSDKGEALLDSQKWTFDLAPGERKRLSKTTQIAAWPEEGFVVRAELIEEGHAIDSTQHGAHVWKPKKDPSFISVEDGDFMLDGKRWRAHGVNYMPSSGIAMEDWDYFEQWIGPRAYDPDIIQRDLDHIKDMGMNSVSIFIYHESMEAQNLLDLLRRLDKMGMKANLSLRPGTPMDFQWDQMRDLIEYYRLRENDCVFALDLAWEPFLGSHEERKQWDGRWREWIVERYGSIENAEKDWGFPAERDENGQVTNPQNSQTVNDGAWRRMMAAYRRFADTLLYEKYSQARTLVRTLDPHHLVSFRMTETGNPTYNWDAKMPYDFPYLAGGVDIIEPEAYGRIGDWERVKPGWFEYEYARWAAPHLPVLWAEAGVHVWDQSRMAITEERLQFQADYYTDLYRMFTNSCVDGIYFWWYPGGYRTNERSDYGIVEPDGTDRPVTKVIRALGDALLNGPDAKPVDHWIECDRDLHPSGLAAVYDAAEEEFWQAIEEGKTPGLRTAGTGTNSANCPLIAVGNTAYNGNNPPKYLDGFFDRVEIKDHTGTWTTVERGDTVKVAPGEPVKARVTVTNLGEAEWLSPSKHEGDGGVYLQAEGTESGRTPIPEPLPRFSTWVVDEVDVMDEGPEGPTSITLTLSAKGRATFGPRYSFMLAP